MTGCPVPEQSPTFPETCLRSAYDQVNVVNARDIAAAVRWRAARVRRAQAKRRAMGAGLGTTALATVLVSAALYVPALRRAIEGPASPAPPALSTTSWPFATGPLTTVPSGDKGEPLPRAVPTSLPLLVETSSAGGP